MTDPYEATRSRVRDLVHELAVYKIDCSPRTIRSLLHAFAVECFRAGQQDVLPQESDGNTIRAPDPRHAGRYSIKDPEGEK